MMSEVSSLLAGHLAAGSLLLTAVLVLGNRLPEGFIRFCAAGSALLAAVAILLGAGPERWAWLLTLLPAGLWYVSSRRGLSGATRLALPSAVMSVLTAAAFALVSEPALPPLAVAGSVSSALLLGAVTVTMVLGHWYLVDTSLAIRPLRDGALWLWLAVVARWTAVGVALALGGWEVLRIGRFADVVFSTSGLFFFFRSLTGLAAPLLLAALIWQTVKIRSTQSATGLLYVALILVLFGELVSQFLLITTGYPL